MSLAALPVYSDNDSVVTIHLGNYTWSGGQPVTARDVAFWTNLLRAGQGYTAASWVGWGSSYSLMNFNNPQTGPLIKRAYIRQAMRSLTDEPAFGVAEVSQEMQALKSNYSQAGIQINLESAPFGRSSASSRRAPPLRCPARGADAQLRQRLDLRRGPVPDRRPAVRNRRGVQLKQLLRPGSGQPDQRDRELWGATAGYFGGIVDGVMMRAVDALLAIPGLIAWLVPTRLVRAKAEPPLRESAPGHRAACRFPLVEPVTP